MVEHIGRYELIEKIAAGGMGEVFRARLKGVEGFSKNLVIKRMRPELRSHPVLVQMFLDEARLIAKLNHPNIVQAFDLGERDGSYFIAMELVEGQHLGGLVRLSLNEQRPLPIELCVYIAARAADGLHFAHELIDPESGQHIRIVHRDISPQNILISRFGDVKITDFGVAKQTTSAQTQTGTVKGKVSYMSPEQCSGYAVCRRCDIFALGIVLFELVTRKRLYKGNDLLAIMERIQNEPPPFASSLNTDVDLELDRIISKALEKDRDMRQQTAAELARELDEWLVIRRKVDLKRVLAEWVGSLQIPLNVTPPPQLVVDSAPGGSGEDDVALKVSWSDLLAVCSTSSVETTAQLPEPSITPVLEARLPRPLSMPEHARHVMERALAGKKTNLTASLSSFVGRQSDLEAIHYLFAEGTRVVTLRGPSGIGKSRLAARYAEAHLDEYIKAGGGVWIADLSEVRSLDGISSAMARALGVPLTTGKSGAEDSLRIGRALAGRGYSLIVLNDFALASELGASTVGHWLTLAPEARFIVTSEQRMGLAGELELELGPLSLPGEPGVGWEGLASEGLRLFIDRARGAKPDFALSDGSLPLAAEIVRRLHCVPLAIELVAARMASRSVSELLAELPLLPAEVASPETVLDMVLERRWGTLSPWEQSALAQCSVFSGGFSLEAAVAILDLSLLPQSVSPLEVIFALKEALLLDCYVAPELTGELRLRLHQRVARFAQQKAIERGLLSATEGRHAQYYLQLGELLTDTAAGRPSRERLTRLSGELDNLMRVQQRAQAHGPPDAEAVSQSLRVALILNPLLSLEGPTSLKVALLNSALSTSRMPGVDTKLVARALEARGRARIMLGRLNYARADLEQASSLAQESGERGVLARARGELGELCRRQGHYEEAAKRFEQAMVLAQEAGDASAEGLVHVRIGSVLYDGGQMDRARESFERGRALFQSARDIPAEITSEGKLGLLHWDLGNLEETWARWERVIELASQQGDRWAEALGRGGLGTLEQERGRTEEALAYYEHAVAILREIGDRRFEALFRGFSAAACAELGFIEEAKASMAEAEALLRVIGDSVYLEVLSLQSGVLDLALARVAVAAGDAQSAAAYRESARQRVLAVEGNEPSSYVHQSRAQVRAPRPLSARVILRILKRALAGLEPPRSSSFLSPGPRSSPRLVPPL